MGQLFAQLNTVQIALKSQRHNKGNKDLLVGTTKAWETIIRLMRDKRNMKFLKGFIDRWQQLFASILSLSLSLSFFWKTTRLCDFEKRLVRIIRN